MHLSKSFIKNHNMLKNPLNLSSTLNELVQKHYLPLVLLQNIINHQYLNNLQPTQTKKSIPEQIVVKEEHQDEDPSSEATIKKSSKHAKSQQKMNDKLQECSKNQQHSRLITP
ncbi:hypothetical protein pb186bvf_007268 [Paramecium bursaria]